MRAFCAKSSLVLVLVLTGLVAGCATPVTRPQQESGFLSDYDGLEAVNDKQLWYQADRLGQYDRFIVERPEILYMPKAGDDEFSDEELMELQDHFENRLTSELTRGDDGYEIVQEAGESVGRFRIAITDLDATDGVLNVSAVTKITGAGLGGAAAEHELVDSQTGEQIAASVNWGSGSRLLRAGFTRLGDAKIQINRWCRDIRNRLDAARKRTEG